MVWEKWEGKRIVRAELLGGYAQFSWQLLLWGSYTAVGMCMEMVGLPPCLCSSWSFPRKARRSRAGCSGVEQDGGVPDAARSPWREGKGRGDPDRHFTCIALSGSRHITVFLLPGRKGGSEKLTSRWHALLCWDNTGILSPLTPPSLEWVWAAPGSSQGVSWSRRERTQETCGSVFFSCNTTSHGLLAAVIFHWLVPSFPCSWGLYTVARKQPWACFYLAQKKHQWLRVWNLTQPGVHISPHLSSSGLSDFLSHCSPASTLETSPGTPASPSSSRCHLCPYLRGPYSGSAWNAHPYMAHLSGNSSSVVSPQLGNIFSVTYALKTSNLHAFDCASPFLYGGAMGTAWQSTVVSEPSVCLSTLSPIPYEPKPSPSTALSLWFLICKMGRSLDWC